MDEYISRQAAMTISPLPKHHREYQVMNLDDAYEAGWLDALDNLKNIPPADVRPVVLCEQCRFVFKNDKYELWCNGFCHPARLVRPDDFCSHGEVET